MRRIKSILALALVMALMLTASVAPAMANNNDNNNNKDNRLDRLDIRLDRKLLNHNDGCFGCLGGFTSFHHFNDCFDGFNCGLDRFDNDFGFLDNCPFAGDHFGIVNEADCFH